MNLRSAIRLPKIDDPPFRVTYAILGPDRFAWSAAPEVTAWAKREMASTPFGDPPLTDEALCNVMIGIRVEFARLYSKL